jgi:hypothetical protein
MRSLIRRVEKLEKKLLPTPQEMAYSRWLRYSLEAGRRRALAVGGEPVPDEPLEYIPYPGPPPKSKRPQKPFDIAAALIEGRKLALKKAREKLGLSKETSPTPTEPEAMEADLSWGDSQ